MKKSLMIVLLGLFVAAGATGARAEVNAGMSIDNDGVKSFFLAIGAHFNVPEKEIVVVREQKIPDDELPVVFFIAQRAGVKPKAVIDLRLGGLSWMEVSLHFGVQVDAYYVNVSGNYGPPYGKALGHFKHHKRNQWREIRLGDPEIIDLVNLRFISDHYGWSPAEVIKMREKGQSFVSINGKVKHAKDEKDKKKQLAREDKPQTKSKGKGKKK